LQRNAGCVNLILNNPAYYKRKHDKRNNIQTPGQDYYLVYDVVSAAEKEFENQQWDITQLEGYLGAQNSALPFAVSLRELMGCVAF